MNEGSRHEIRAHRALPGLHCNCDLLSFGLGWLRGGTACSRFGSGRRACRGLHRLGAGLRLLDLHIEAAPVHDSDDVGVAGPLQILPEQLNQVIQLLSGGFNLLPGCHYVGGEILILLPDETTKQPRQQSNEYG